MVNLPDATELPEVEYNPVSVEKSIIGVVNEKARGIVTARDAYKELLDARKKYKRERNRAYMLHKGPQTEKKIAAEIVPEVMAAEDDMDVKDVAYQYAKDLNELSSDKLEAMRSVGASVRKAYENTGRGDWF
ncbi:Uncharacterised protein [Mycobacteroides abscessus subsp. abscessus]|nr:Uncharacterised protein [Mycobacteroides abscessus subsp. abscessus]